MLDAVGGRREMARHRREPSGGLKHEGRPGFNRFTLSNRSDENWTSVSSIFLGEISGVQNQAPPWTRGDLVTADGLQQVLLLNATDTPPNVTFTTESFSCLTFCEAFRFCRVFRCRFFLTSHKVSTFSHELLLFFLQTGAADMTRFTSAATSYHK